MISNYLLVVKMGMIDLLWARTSLHGGCLGNFLDEAVHPIATG